MAVKIILDPSPHGPFYVAGDKVTGKAIIESSKKKLLEKATVTCFAKENADIKHGDYHYFPNRQHFHFTIQCITEVLEIPEGETSFAFSFELPLNEAVANLGPVRVGCSQGKFIIENIIEFSIKFKSIFGSYDECRVPLPIAPLYNPASLGDRNNYVYEESGKLESCCDCFGETSYAKIKITGLSKIARMHGKVTVPLKIFIKCDAKNPPKHFSVILDGCTRVKYLFLNLESVTYFFQSFKWDLSLPMEDEYFVMPVDAKFEVNLYELLSAQAYCWERIYHWRFNVGFKDGTYLNEKIPIKFGPFDNEETLTEAQKIMARMISSV